MSTAAAQRALSAVSEQAAALGAAVNSRVLFYDEAAAVQVPQMLLAACLMCLHASAFVPNISMIRSRDFR